MTTRRVAYFKHYVDVHNLHQVNILHIGYDLNRYGIGLTYTRLTDTNRARLEFSAEDEVSIQRCYLYTDKAVIYKSMYKDGYYSYQL